MEVRSDGSVPPPPAPAPATKKKSGIWNALKWLGGGVVLGIAGYEGLKMWKRLKGENGDVELNPGAAALPPAQGQHPGPMSVVPQPMPFPFPMPWPAPAAPQHAPQAVANPVADDDVSPKERRAARKQRQLEERLARIEEAIEEEEY